VVSMTHPTSPDFMEPATSLVPRSHGPRRCLRHVHGEQGILINGVQVLITGYTTDPTYHTVTGLLLLRRRATGPISRSRSSPCPSDSAMDTEEGCRCRSRGKPSRIPCTIWTSAEADGRRARTLAASVLFDSARAAWAPYKCRLRRMTPVPGEWTFDTNQSYAQMADGSMLANLLVTGKLPVNEFSATGAVRRNWSISQSATADRCHQRDAARGHLRGRFERASSAPSNIAIIGQRGGGRLVHVGEHYLPAVAASFPTCCSWLPRHLICAQPPSVDGGPNNTYTPGSITFAAAGALDLGVTVAVCQQVG